MRFFSTILGFIFWLSMAAAADFKVVVKFGDKVNTFEMASSGSKVVISEVNENSASKKINLNSENAQFMAKSIESVFLQKSHDISLCPTHYIWIQKPKSDRSRVACLRSNTKMTESAIRVANSFSTAFQFL